MLPYWSGVYLSSLFAEEALCLTLAWMSWSARLAGSQCRRGPAAARGHAAWGRSAVRVVREGNVLHVHRRWQSKPAGARGFGQAEVIRLSTGPAR